jgi:hypothetical protein
MEGDELPLCIDDMLSINVHVRFEVHVSSWIASSGKQNQHCFCFA